MGWNSGSNGRKSAERTKHANLGEELDALTVTDSAVRDAHRRLLRTTQDMIAGSYADREKRIADFRRKADEIWRAGGGACWAEV